MGVAVAALGSAAGAAVGKLVAPKKHTWGADPSIPGITSATIKKGGKGKPDITVPQVDPSQSYSFFNRAAQQQEEQLTEGLKFYTQTLEAAGRELESSYAKATAELRPIATAGISAMNEQLKFLGLTPVRPTAGIREQLTGIGQFSELQDKLADADEILDPGARMGAKQAVLRQFEAEATRAKEADTKKRLQMLAEEYDRTYAEELDRPYTPEEVTERIAATPGYQFQFEQGTKAIERSAAAQGMLASGNTLLALQEFGQQTAAGYFQQHLANLSDVATRGSVASQQISAYQASRGQDMATLVERGGEATRQTAGLIGEARAQASYAKGQMAFEAARVNAMLQQQGIMQGRSIDARIAQQGMASAPAIMQAQTQRGYLGLQMGQMAGLGLARTMQVPGIRV
jgi:hypothetical protein